MPTESPSRTSAIRCGTSARKVLFSRTFSTPEPCTSSAGSTRLRLERQRSSKTRPECLDPEGMGSDEGGGRGQAPPLRYRARGRGRLPSGAGRDRLLADQLDVGAHRQRELVELLHGRRVQAIELGTGVARDERVVRHRGLRGGGGGQAGGEQRA